MKRIHALVFVLAASVSSIAGAVDYLSEMNAAAPGTRTDAWLSAQREGSMASSNIQPAKSIQRDKAAERFMKTYDFSIKESYYGESFTPGS